METLAIRSLAEMDAFAEKILRLLSSARSAVSAGSAGAGSGDAHATLVALSGDLGAGKTAFAKSFAKALGVGEGVTSPTFVIEKIYALQGKPWKQLVHIDAYRLEGGHELLSLGFEEMLRDPAHLILVEWPEIVPTAIPAGADLSLAFRFVDESVREVSYDAHSLLKTHA